MKEEYNKVDMSISYKDLEMLLSKSGISFEKKGKTTSLRFKRDESELDNVDNEEELYSRTLKCLERVFNLKDFDDYFTQATSGSGKEAEKIDTIWSSSLLSLLFFHDACTRNKGLIIEGVRYKKCFFEFKNPVLVTHPCSKYPSNIDCVLMDEKDKHILFIESKFIEYIRDFRKNGKTQKDRLSENYSIEGEPTKEVAKWFNKLKGDHYYYGLKQMITHFSGICNFLNGTFHKEMENDVHRKAIINAYQNGADVRLIEIVYSFAEVLAGKYKKFFNDYESMQKQVVARLNALNKFTILKMKSYQKIVEENKLVLSKTIKDFYSL